MKIQNTDGLVNSVQAARVLGITPRMVRYLAHDGRIGQVISDGRRKYFAFSRHELATFKQNRRKPGRPRNGK